MRPRTEVVTTLRALGAFALGFALCEPSHAASSSDDDAAQGAYDDGWQGSDDRGGSQTLTLTGTLDFREARLAPALRLPRGELGTSERCLLPSHRDRARDREHRAARAQAGKIGPAATHLTQRRPARGRTSG